MPLPSHFTVRSSEIEGNGHSLRAFGEVRQRSGRCAPHPGALLGHFGASWQAFRPPRSSDTPASTCTSPRPARHGSTRSNAGSPKSRTSRSGAEATEAPGNSCRPSRTTWPSTTRTPGPSSGRSQPTTSWNPSKATANGLPIQDTSGPARTDNVLPLSGRPDLPGKTNSERGESARAAVSTSSARRASGTRCRLPVFMRSPGIVHVAASRSISSHRAPRTSPLRQAVRTSISNASFALASALDARTPVQRRRNLAVRQRPLVPDADVVLRKRRADGVSRRIVLSVSLRHRAVHHRPDALAYYPRCHALPVPEVVGEQYAHHVCGGDLVDPLVTQARHRVVPQRASPLGFVLAARPPRGAVNRDHRLSGLGERRDPTRAGITALGNRPAVLKGFLPGECRTCARATGAGAL